MKKTMAVFQIRRWLEISNSLAALHKFIYGVSGPFAYLRDTPISPTCKEAADCIRMEFSMPRRHANQRGWLKATATLPLKALNQVIGEDRAHYTKTMTGRTMLAKIRWLRMLINSADASS